MGLVEALPPLSRAAEDYLALGSAITPEPCHQAGKFSLQRRYKEVSDDVSVSPRYITVLKVQRGTSA